MPRLLALILCVILIVAPMMSSRDSSLIPFVYIYLLLLISIIFMHSFSKSIISKKNISRTLILMAGLVGVILIVSVTSSLSSELPMLSFQRSILNFFLMFTILIYVASDDGYQKTFNKASDLISILSVPLIIIAIGVYLIGSGDTTRTFTVLNLKIEHPITNGIRAAGFWGNPNTFAAFILYISPFVIYSALIQRRKTWFSLFVIIVMLAGTAISLSRTGIAVYIIFLTLFFYISGGNRLKIAIWLLIIIIILPVGYLAMFVAEDAGSLFSRLSQADLSGRELAWIQLLNYFYDNIFFGAGFGVSQEAILEPNNINFPAHNIYLMLLSEVGVFGIIPFLIFLFVPTYLFYVGIRLSAYDKKARMLYALLFSFSLAVLVQQMLETHIFRYSFAMVLWLYICAFGIKSLQILLRSKKLKVKEDFYYEKA